MEQTGCVVVGILCLTDNGVNVETVRCFIPHSIYCLVSALTGLSPLSAERIHSYSFLFGVSLVARDVGYCVGLF